ncbi:hypothetical protein MSI_16210 [Treponema sp. JC4]|uniref:hypothetical protein n=1 Tax=Treponema sp. JC4 TaxID=1124982 RepID=UPI00025B0E1F|nr:hypothetical protein [Treponema sp. JC4]EID84925.1 hypothetical protein MSI_16210 [Treponema sp. JC4]
MKKLICFATAALFSFQIFAIDIFTTGAVSQTGKVKSFTRTDYSVTTKFGNYFRTPAAKTTHNFTDGKETEEIHLTPRDVVIRKVVFTYDDNGDLSEKVCSNAENDLEWKTAMTYKDGVQQDHSEYDNTGNLKARTIYTYTDGLMTDKTVYDGEGALLEKTIYAYTDSGKIATLSNYGDDGALREKQTYAYTVEGVLDAITYFDKDLKESRIESMRYDDVGLLTEVTTYENDKVVKRTLVKYDEKANVSRISEYNIADKFGTTVNELIGIAEFTYVY